MKHFKNRNYLLSLATAICFLAGSFVVYSYAIAYTNRSISKPVTDIVLSNTRVYNVDGLFVYGAVLLVAFIFLACCLKLGRAPFILKSIALFVIIRSGFISLTHISPYPEHIAITSSVFTRMFPSVFTGDDLFFSGHVGLSFLMAVILWRHRFWRFLFLGFSVLFSLVVLLGHLHYSIDVASAFFISYGIANIAKFFFKKDWEQF